MDEGCGFCLVGKVVLVGLEWLDWFIKFVIGYGLEGGDREDRSNDGLSEVNEDVDRDEIIFGLLGF